MDSTDRPAPRLVTVAVLVGTTYYIGAQIGLALTFPPATTSVLWPPNAILTAALLLVPPRAWWVCLMAALPVHLLLETNAGFPPALVGGLFVTNCSEALLAAIGMRALSDAPTRFDSLRRVAVFISVAGLAAPIISSFADAGVVNQIRGEPYWTVWRTRVFANTLTELSVVPAVILGWSAMARIGRPRNPRRAAETVALGVGLVGAALVVFGAPSLRDAVPGMPRTPTVLLLPVFCWAAVRFGVGGVSAALLVSAGVASYETATGYRPFAMLPPLESLMAVQMYLTVVAIPWMCIAGLLAERRRATRDLAARLRFEELLSRISTSFVSLPHDAPSSAFDDCLARAGEFLRIDCAVLLRFDETSRDLGSARQWNAADVAPLTAVHSRHQFPAAIARVLDGETIIWKSIDSLPVDAHQDRQQFEALGLRSAVVLPFVVGSVVRGALSVATVRERTLSDVDIIQLRLVGEVLANAYARRQAELEAQRSRQELAHVARLSSMGELAASLAHQLNQPLTGILSNAEGMQLVLESGKFSLTEIQETAGDIIDDSRRARDVIQRMREMVAPTDAPPVMLDMNALIRDVAVLLVSDTLIRNVSVSLEFEHGLPLVSGDRVLLQQVILNVVMNAIDAVIDLPVPDRTVSVRTMLDGRGLVQVRVRDRGTGLPPGAEQQIFEAFFSTKPTGTGMGLAIARSIVENHGGSIWAENEPTGGAVVTISLPAFAEIVT